MSMIWMPLPLPLRWRWMDRGSGEEGKRQKKSKTDLIRVGVFRTCYRFCTPPASLSHCLFKHSTLKLLPYPKNVCTKQKSGGNGNGNSIIIVIVTWMIFLSLDFFHVGAVGWICFFPSSLPRLTNFFNKFPLKIPLHNPIDINVTPNVEPWKLDACHFTQRKCHQTFSFEFKL